MSCAEHAEATLIFIHGTPGDRGTFKKYLGDKNLKEKFNMISIDRPGFGDFSQKLELSFKEQTAAIVNLAKELFSANQKMTCVGYSYGAPLCLNVLIDYPDSFTKGILIAGPYNPHRKIVRWYNKIASLPLIRVVLSKGLLHSNQEMYNLKTELLKLEPKISKLKELPVIVHGEADRIVPVEDSDFLFQKFNGVKKRKQYHRWSDAGHLLIWNRFIKIKDVILKAHEL